MDTIKVQSLAWGVKRLCQAFYSEGLATTMTAKPVIRVVFYLHHAIKSEMGTIAAASRAIGVVRSWKALLSMMMAFTLTVCLVRDV